MATGVEDAGFLRLRQAGGAFYLDHSGTGELAHLEGGWALKFAHGGFGLLESTAKDKKAQQWASAHLAKRLFKQRDGHGKERLFIQSELGKSAWRDDIMHSDHSIGCLVYRRAGKEVAFEALLHDIPRFGSRVWFNLSRILAPLIGSGCDGRWFCTRLRFFKAFLLKLQLDENNLQQSYHSHAAKAVKAGSQLNPDSLLASGREFTGSALGALALRFGVGGTKLAIPGVSGAELPQR